MASADSPERERLEAPGWLPRQDTEVRDGIGHGLTDFESTLPKLFFISNPRTENETCFGFDLQSIRDSQKVDVPQACPLADKMMRVFR